MTPGKQLALCVCVYRYIYTHTHTQEFNMNTNHLEILLKIKILIQRDWGGAQGCTFPTSSKDHNCSFNFSTYTFFKIFCKKDKVFSIYSLSLPCKEILLFLNIEPYQM